MLTTTRSFSRQACSTRLRCPACRAPSVGTSPIDSPSRCQRRDTSSAFRGSSITAAFLSGAVLDLVFCLGRRRRGPIRRIGVLRPGELPAGDLSGEPLGGVPDLLGEVGVALDELGRLAGGQAKGVVENQDLAVGSGAGADSDRRDAKRLRDAGAKLGWNAFQHEAERPGLL